MVAKNNYYWTSDCKEMDFIANGEIVQILRVRRTTELYGFRFADVTVRFQDYDLELDIKDTARHPTDRHPCPAERAKRQAVLHHPGRL